MLGIAANADKSVNSYPCARNIEIKLTFSSFNIGNMFSVKDPQSSSRSPFARCLQVFMCSM